VKSKPLTRNTKLRRNTKNVSAASKILKRTVLSIVWKWNRFAFGFIKRGNQRRRACVREVAQNPAVTKTAALLP
uniref:Uncharacterized protein n=1 Tax=Fundulus heteroclitus TaxID=8078 RepID=A0A3Q2PUA4_FUNHE